MSEIILNRVIKDKKDGWNDERIIKLVKLRSNTQWIDRFNLAVSKGQKTDEFWKKIANSIRKKLTGPKAKGKFESIVKMYKNCLNDNNSSSWHLFDSLKGDLAKYLESFDNSNSSSSLFDSEEEASESKQLKNQFKKTVDSKTTKQSSFELLKEIAKSLELSINSRKDYYLKASNYLETKSRSMEAGLEASQLLPELNKNTQMLSQGLSDIKNMLAKFISKFDSEKNK